MLLFLASCQEKKFDRLERETKDFTERNCPKQIDAMVTLDSLVFHNDGSLDYIYYYSIGMDVEQRRAFDKMKDYIRESTLKAIRNNIELRIVKESGLNIICLYRDKADGKELVRYTFTKEDYQ